MRAFAANLVGITVIGAVMTLGPMAQADPLAPEGKVLNIAHRGASGHAPEATLPAFDKARALNADYLELDAQLTRDGKLVAFHDTKVDRTTDGSGKLGEFTLSELQQLDAGSWFNAENPDKADSAFEGLRVPTLDQIVARYGTDEKYYIEIKSPDANPGLSEALVNWAEGHGLVEANAIVIQSFSQDALERAHALNPEIPLVQLVWYHPKGYEEGAALKEWSDVTPGPANLTEADLAAINDYAVGLGTNLTYKDRQVIDAAFVETVREAGLGLHVYTINDKATMRQLLDWGVTGLFTNYPDRLNAVLDR
ncbi:glycerophosphodiester phosphodiesterase [Rhodovibrio salinarum]|uniref:Glycerophosphodiester phosphodiesterase n=1 Tax=Rhodovibrio salinarum TaxID=1087 RepID=A0A934V2A0_9PROT|nr:glycerophosphodiester phosphodiesterase [Rhodovibrio salinarum]MBK1698684.1 glycerophosphodiester phosphodiesterase [Rhodovibrio salinarum]